MEEEERLLFNRQRLKNLSTDDREDEEFFSFAKASLSFNNNHEGPSSHLDFKHEGSSRDFDFKREASSKDFDFKYEASSKDFDNSCEKKTQDNSVNESQELEKQIEDAKEFKIENQDNSARYSQQKDERLLKNKDSKELDIENQGSNSVGEAQDLEKQN